MKVISEFPSFIPAKGFFPSKTKSSYLMLPAGCIPTRWKVSLENLPVASVLIARKPRQPARRIHLLLETQVELLLVARVVDSCSNRSSSSSVIGNQGQVFHQVALHHPVHVFHAVEPIAQAEVAGEGL